MIQGATVLLMGPPGAGKGTQAQHLVEQHGFRHIATGDVLRTAVAEGTELGLQAKSYMNAGELVPDDLIIGMLVALIEQLDSATNVLLDGFPRTVAQATALTTALAKLDREVDRALDITVPQAVLIERLASRWICRSCQRPYNVVTSPPRQAGVCDACGGELYQRADDTAEAAAKRLAVYAQQTRPVSDFYADRGVRVEIDGNRSPQRVEAAIDAALAHASATSGTGEA